MVRYIAVDKPLLRLGMTLGEGCVWDVRKQRLYFVDIDQCKVYTYEPSTETIGYQTFARKVTAIALTAKGDGLLGTSDDAFIYIPASSLPFPPTSSQQPFTIVGDGQHIEHGLQEKRFNDAAVDPVGRFLAGTMGKEHHQRVGKMYSLGTNGHWDTVMDGLSCSNGMGWSEDGKAMYLTDSWCKDILAFDYNTIDGSFSSRRVFSHIDDPAFGEPDGLCMDSTGGVWSARWQAGKVIRLSPEGVIDVIIEFPTAWHMTCVVFGGETLQDLYVTTAKTDYNGEILPDRSDGGHLFVVKDTGYKGVERNRYGGDFTIPQIEAWIGRDANQLRVHQSEVVILVYKANFLLK